MEALDISKDCHLLAVLKMIWNDKQRSVGTQLKLPETKPAVYFQTAEPRSTFLCLNPQKTVTKR